LPRGFFGKAQPSRARHERYDRYAAGCSDARGDGYAIVGTDQIRSVAAPFGRLELAMSGLKGTRFGPYEITALIGVGGMGEVYLATDTNLKRNVALKVLPDSFVTDATRLARLQREAELLAALNHPNVAQIYGLERSDGRTALVMELIEGPTLAEQLTEGPLPPKEALEVAQQVAAALETAHERGIVHRDLKPANIKLKPDGTVRVLDFGIAKALDARTPASGQPPALTTPAMTEAGFVLGTAAYMSPEQARGKPVDRRADVWAFGCVLYEMLTGKAAFLGDDVTTTLARVLQAPVDLDSLPAGVSPSVRRTLELCLAKDARERIADMRDVRHALGGAFATDAPARSPARPTLPIAASAATAALLAAIAGWLLKPAPRPEPLLVTRFDHVLAEGLTLGSPVASLVDVAPNGELFAFVGNDGIHARRMGDVAAQAVPGARGNVLGVALSPDGTELAYFRGLTLGQLVKTAIGGGAPQVLVDTVQQTFGLRWEPNGYVYYDQPDGIWRVSQTGGTPERVVETDPGEQAYAPQLLPGGEWLLFTVARIGTDVGRREGGIVVQSLVNGERRLLRAGGHNARYVPTGHIVYAVEADLFASTFDVGTFEFGDEHVGLIQGIQGSRIRGAWTSSYGVSNNGTLAFVPSAAARPRRSLVWVDREGNEELLPLRPDDYTQARISPDGTRVALVLGGSLPPSDPPPDIYVVDIASENPTQLTFDPQPDDGPVWSRDSARIFYRSFSGALSSGTVYAISPEGGVPEVETSQIGAYPLPWSISHRNSTLLTVDATSQQDVNLSAIDIGRKEDNFRPLLDIDVPVSEPSISLNEEWLLYTEITATGEREVNLRPFADVRQQRRPVGRGRHPVFSPDGSEIFLFDGAGLSVAPVQYAPTLRVGSVRSLFRGEYWYGIGGADGDGGRAWDLDPKNDRFLMIKLPPRVGGDPALSQPRVSVVLNFFEELEQRVPTR
jgi:serine/threonine-protein kinase